LEIRFDFIASKQSTLAQSVNLLSNIKCDALYTSYNN